MHDRPFDAVPEVDSKRGHYGGSSDWIAWSAYQKEITCVSKEHPTRNQPSLSGVV